MKTLKVKSLAIFLKEIHCEVPKNSLIKQNLQFCAEQVISAQENFQVLITRKAF